MRINVNKLLGLESQKVEGSMIVERELVWYIRGVDIEALKEAATSAEYQEQYAAKFPQGQIRVRMTEKDAEIGYELTAKAWKKNSPDRLETNSPTTEDMFKTFRMLADSGMHKTRYHIETEHGVFEYDVFYVDGDRNGEVVPWLKVDLEWRNVDHPDGLTHGDVTLPILGDEIIEDNPHDRTEEQSATISELYDEYFTV